MDKDRRFAVLIDADNVSDKYIRLILDELSNDGIITYKRIYGDWTRPALGSWKSVLLAVTILLSVVIYRPFGTYLCPLGAVYSVFNPIAVFRYRIDKEKCTGCGACARVCKMQVDPAKNVNHAECIRCGACKDACPVKVIY